jgi:hypothetical protein
VHDRTPLEQNGESAHTIRIRSMHLAGTVTS